MSLAEYIPGDGCDLSQPTLAEKLLFIIPCKSKVCNVNVLSFFMTMITFTRTSEAERRNIFTSSNGIVMNC